MEEFTVHKQGSIRASNWTQRVLSLHATLGLAALSDKSDSNNKLSRCMRVDKVEMWPQYPTKYIKESAQSMEAKLTLRVEGLPAQVGYRDRTTADASTRVYRFTRSSRSAEHLTWVLRFSSVDELEKAVRLLHAMKVKDASELTQSSTGSVAQETLGDSAEEVRHEVDTTATAEARSVMHGNVEEELRVLRDAAMEQSRPERGFTAL